MTHVLKFISSFLLVTATAGLSSYFSYLGVNTFYSSLQLPPLNPPNEVFPFIWPFLYVLMIISFYIILEKENNHNAVLLFVGQLFLHIFWCYLFFTQGWFAFAFIDLALLIWTVFVMLKKFYDLSHWAAFLQYPYLVWLLFALYLNAGIWYLNDAFLAK